MIEAERSIFRAELYADVPDSKLSLLERAILNRGHDAAFAPAAALLADWDEAMSVFRRPRGSAPSKDL